MSHTPECIRARGGPDTWPLMWMLKTGAQEAVLACPDPTHDSVRFVLQGKPYVSLFLALTGWHD